MDLLISVADGICKIELNRPQKKNALTAGMYLSLARTLAHAEENPEVRVALLCGQTGTFTAGNDLDDFNGDSAASSDSPALRDMGFVNKVLPDEALLDYATAQAKQLASLPSAALTATKALLKSGSRKAVDEQLERESALFRQLLAGPAAREAMAAFREKRKPDFSRA